MDNNIILTITVPVYNTEQYLDKCLGSLVVSEELMNLFEVLVVIDGSKDNSIEIARKYEANYPNTFRVIDKENGGHGSCCNVGVREARGKYIHFLDSDDWFDGQFSAYLIRLKNENADVVFTKCLHERIYENSSFLHEFHNIEYDRNYTIESLRDVSLSFSIHEASYSVNHFRRYNVRFREKVFYDDVILSVAGLLGTETIAFYNFILYHYLCGRPGQTMNPVIISKNFNYRCYSVYDCFTLYEKSLSLISPTAKYCIIRNLGWNLDRLYTDAWKQDKIQAKKNIEFLNEMFKKRIENNGIKKNYIMTISLYLPFSCGYILINKVLKYIFRFV
jgi:glycosyltransferase involved in cell wall biosynthesis